MNKTFFFSFFGLLLMNACNTSQNPTKDKQHNMTHTDSTNFKSGYSMVNGIKIYYEIYGEGKPLVLLHGGGSTIQSSFGRIIPELAKKYRIIAVELQNHGRTGSRNTPETFEQDAEDVVTLLKNLNIEKASFLGFSNGGTTALLIGARYPAQTENLVLAAAAYRRDGLIPGFFEGMKGATLSNMPQSLKTAFLDVNPDTAALQIMFERDRDRMINFTDYPDELLKSIQAPTLLINGDKDVVTLEHTIKMYRLIPHGRLAILPGGHGAYLGELSTIGNGTSEQEFALPIILQFLDQPGS
jgi:pimeloyl-ACP methyl ester carboxylesterase